MHAVGVPNTYNAEDLRRAGADDVIDGLTGLNPAWVHTHFAGPSPGR